MRIDVLTGIPGLVQDPLGYSIIKKGIQKGLVNINVHNLHDYADDKYRTIDDYAYGGQAGMVLKPEPIFRCAEKLMSENTYDDIIFMSPDGLTLNQSLVNQFSQLENIMLIAGHYKGIDQRIRDHLVTKEISIGDYVLSGGELPAIIFIDAVIRLIPGVLGDVESALTDSFQDDLLDAPVYTRPAEYKGYKVPEILVSGNHKDIQEWQLNQAIQKTKDRRPDLLNKK